MLRLRRALFLEEHALILAQIKNLISDFYNYHEGAGLEYNEHKTKETELGNSADVYIYHLFDMAYLV